MERNKVKPDMVYAIQTAIAPGAQTPSSVPYIVNSTTVDLVDVINRARHLFPRVTVAVAESRAKRGVGTTFTLHLPLTHRVQKQR